jgi:CBS domain-containing protein
MAAVLAGSMRLPLTAIIFAVELTHEINMFVPLLIGCAVAHGFTALTMPRSILTEKLSRRGFHLSREYSVDPLELLFVREVMRSNIVALPASMRISELANTIRPLESGHRGQWLYPVVASATDASLMGVLTRRELQKLATDRAASHDGELVSCLRGKKPAIVAYSDEPLRAVVYRMAASGITRMPVLEGAGDGEHASAKLVGLIALQDLLKARSANWHAERTRQRVLPLRIFFPRFSAKTDDEISGS